jgi:hypothetical protein
MQIDDESKSTAASNAKDSMVESISVESITGADPIITDEPNEEKIQSVTNKKSEKGVKIHVGDRPEESIEEPYNKSF